MSGLVAEVSAEHAPYKITGFACPVGALPSGRETQLLFVNHRFARDRLLTHAAKEALIQSRGLGREREVAFALFLELPTELVDANAHPAKTEVRFKDPRAAHQFVYKALSEALAKLPPPEPDSNESRINSPQLYSDEREQDLFGEGVGGAGSNGLGIGSGPEVSNEAERFLGPLRGGLCAWDAGDGLWLAPLMSLAAVPTAFTLSARAEEGTLLGIEQLIPAAAKNLCPWRSILMARSSQLQALGLDLEWKDNESCLISFSPEGFDNCDWSKSLWAIGALLSQGKSDALSLCCALASGLDLPAPGRDDIWNSAASWMRARRLARELPGAFFAPFPGDDDS